MSDPSAGASDGTVVLPEHLTEQVANLPETHMGVHTITVTLKDGRVIPGVHVAWATEVVRVDGEDRIPFRGEDVAAVDDGSGLA